MSNRRKNNHYHYAEKFEDRRYAKRNRAYMPFKSVIISLVVLLMFGLVSTTFATFVSENEPSDSTELSPIISEVRNIKASREVSVTGANADLASTGISVKSGTKTIYFDASSTSWTNVQLFVGKGSSGTSSWTSVYNMTNIPNTKIWYVSFDGWTDATYLRFVTGCSGWGDGQWGTSNIPSSGNYTGIFDANYDLNGGSTYCFAPASTLSSALPNPTYQSSPANNYKFNQTVEIHSNSTGSYTKNAAGGSVDITAYYMSSNTAVGGPTTASSGASDTVTYENAAKTTSISYKANPNTGYTFEGWFSSTGATISTDNPYSTTVSGESTLYARFLKRVKVTVAKYPTSYTGTPTANPTEVSPGSDVSLNADVKTGVTFGGWTISGSYTGGTLSNASTTIKPTTDVTATANYTLNPPTNLSLSYPSVLAGQNSTPTKSATSPSSGTLTYSYSIAPAAGTTAAAGTFSVNTTSGVVSATTPGKYNVTMSVTTSAYGLTSAAATIDAEVLVRPNAPTRITHEFSGYSTGDGTGLEYTSPFKVPVNSTSFTIKSYIPTEDRISGYTYNWIRSDGTYLMSTGYQTAGSHSVTTNGTPEVTDVSSACTATTDVVHNTVLTEGYGYFYKISVTASVNGVTSDPFEAYIYYAITGDFLSVEKFDFSSFNATDPVQKIYAEDNTVSQIDAAYEAGGTRFDTMLWFSHDNINFNKVAVWTDRGSFTIGNNLPFAGIHSPLPNDAAHTTSGLQTSLSTYTRNLVNLMSFSGPKWFKGYVDDYSNTKVSAAYPELRTTVGTASSVSDRPIYYIDATGNSYADSRVMAFYLTSSDGDSVNYQTAQAVKSGDTVKYYRVYVPSDATKITFAHVANNSYVLPTYNNGTFSYAVYSNKTVLMAWTETVDLTDTANRNKTAYKATTSNTDSSNQINNYTGEMTLLD